MDRYLHSNYNIETLRNLPKQPFLRPFHVCIRSCYLSPFPSSLLSLENIHRLHESFFSALEVVKKTCIHFGQDACSVDTKEMSIHVVRFYEMGSKWRRSVQNAYKYTPVTLRFHNLSVETRLSSAVALLTLVHSLKTWKKETIAG